MTLSLHAGDERRWGLHAALTHYLARQDEFYVTKDSYEAAFLLVARGVEAMVDIVPLRKEKHVYVFSDAAACSRHITAYYEYAESTARPAKKFSDHNQIMRSRVRETIHKLVAMGRIGEDMIPHNILTRIRNDMRTDYYDVYQPGTGLQAAPADPAIRRPGGGANSGEER